ncbi:hypothetical protein [Streptomyces daliensis]|uniref:Uncharacterized protein n=1 Tax=Streptomyces daliensis TaxID=299421 RepID=A0A8T4J1E9_9ACTN|nr:hypothetical protein [Streptomyces daliensis]
MPSEEDLGPTEGETREERGARNERLLGARLASNSSVNLLTPVLLNACRKRSEGGSLSDLESDLVDLVKLAGTSQDEVAGWGRAFAALDAGQSAALFPQDTSELDADSSYSYADAARDLPKYWDVISELPNVITPGVSGGAPKLPSARDVQRFGWSQVLPTGDGEYRAAMPKGGYYHAALVQIETATCHHHTVGEAGTDEVYFVLHSVVDRGVNETTMSETVENFTDGVTQRYDHLHYADGLFDPDKYPPAPKMKSFIAILEGWEEDHGKSKVLEKIKEKANEISEKLIGGIKDPSKKKAQIQAAVGIVLAIVALFVEAWCDDFIAHETIEGDYTNFENKDEKSVTLVRKNDYGYEVLNWGKYEALVWFRYVKGRT